MTTDYYEILEIQRMADENDIKKAYRKMALRWHPDKNPDNKEEAEAKFKEISEAYEVLSDKEKRNIYNKRGKEGLAENGACSSYENNYNEDHFPGPSVFHFTFRDPEEVFREVFGGMDPFADFFSNTGFPGFGASLFGPDPFGFDPFGDPFSLAGPSLFASCPNPSITGRRSRQPAHHHHHHQQQRGRIQPYARPQQQSVSRSASATTSNNLLRGMTLLSNFPGFGIPSFGGTAVGLQGGGGGGANFKSTSMSTKIVNGKPIVTKKVVENGIETITIEENGRIKSKTVNGRRVI